MDNQLSQVKVFANSTLRIIILAAASLAILIYRRPSQFLHPYIWVEEGTITLPHYLHDGWLSLLSPVAGYIVLPAKIIFMLAATISFPHLPMLTYWLTIAFTISVAMSVALCPTYLKWPSVCAIAILLIPTDAEVFAVSEYAFWWGTLLAVVSVLWKSDGGKVALRSLLTLVGGLSSPLIIPLAPIFLFRALRFRTRNETLTFIVALTAAIAQAASILHTGNLAHSDKVNLDPIILVGKFFGYFVFWSQNSQAAMWQSATIGVALIVALIAITYRHRAKLDVGIPLLAVCLAIAITSTVTRISPDMINPILAGPRYFFFPYIFLAWLLIQAAAVGGIVSRSIIAAIMILTMHQTWVYGQRTHDTIDWRAEIHSCTLASTYELPIHYDGVRSHAWKVELSGADCRKLISRSMF